MTTAYNLADRLPKDSDGDKHWALTSPDDLDFVLPKALGASAFSSKDLGHLAVATHAASTSASAPATIIAIGGVYLTNAAASPVQNGDVGMARMNNYGEIYTRGASVSHSLISTGSRNTATTTGTFLYGVHVAASGAHANDTIAIKNGTANVMGFSLGPSTFTVPSPNIPIGGLYFNSGVVVDMSLAGGGATASVTLMYRN